MNTRVRKGLSFFLFCKPNIAEFCGMSDFRKLFESFAGLRVGIIGDVMLDTYMWGAVDRISPEAPVPVVSLRKKEYRIGGAGNVALNCRSLGSAASILSVTGSDPEGDELKSLFESHGIDTGWLLQSSGRITTNKTRIISRSQQMMRLDAEITRDLSTEEENDFLQTIARYLDTVKPHAVILEDYNKGVLTGKIIRQTIQWCRERNIPVSVDPKRNNFFAYQGASIFKPNLKEVKDALNITVADITEENLRAIHRELSARLQHTVSFITLSEKGVFYQQAEESRIIPSHMRNIADVSGAGDTVIAMATLVYAVTGNVGLMAETANIAGGLVCEEVGTAAINRDRLLQECESLLG